MSKSLLLLATCLTLPVAGVVLWMVTPASAPNAVRETARDGTARVPDAYAPSAVSRPVMAAGLPLADTSKIVRRSDEDFPELKPDAPATAPAAPAPVASPRFTLATPPNAAVQIQGLMNTAAPNERIRVLPADVVQAGSPERSAPRGTAPGAGAIVLQVDGSLHDPAAWVEGEKPLGEPQADLKEKIADAFASDVAAAAKNPEPAGPTLDDTWKAARARSNWQYQKFFGDAAANRATINAGRASLSKP